MYLPERTEGYAAERSSLVLYALSSMLLLVCGWLFLSYRIVPVNRDAGYFVSVAREILGGLTPTAGVDTAYTPFVYYVYAVWMKVVPGTWENLVLLVYLVHVLNAVLVGLVCARMSVRKAACLIVSTAYFSSVIVCEGYGICLEPFQVTFALVALLALLVVRRSPAAYAFSGLALGVSIMFKQYSVFMLAGFAASLVAGFPGEARREMSLRARLGGIVVMIAASVVPFFAFVSLTEATCVDALVAFGFLGHRATGYALDTSFGLHQRLAYLYDNATYLYWLFLPALAYAVVGRDKDDTMGSARIPAMVLAFSAFPLAVRWYKHYFQLVAPWSFILAGMLLESALREPFAKGRPGRLLAWITVCVVMVLVPVFAEIRPSFRQFSPRELFRVALVSAFFLWAFRFRLQASAKAWVPAVLALVLGECLLCTAEIPFWELEQQKRVQLVEAGRMMRVLGWGSEVIVVDIPHLYVLCGYRHPGGDYGFILPTNVGEKMGKRVLSRTENVILKAGHPLDGSGYLERHGFKRVGVVAGTDIVRYEKPLGDVPGAGRDRMRVTHAR